jgi:hypothetical protein
MPLDDRKHQLTITVAQISWIMTPPGNHLQIFSASIIEGT